MNKINIISNTEELPFYATPNSSGMDLKANLSPEACIDLVNSGYAPDMDEEGVPRFKLNPGDRVIVPTGLFIELPIGHEAQIRPRSGLAIKTGVTVLNSPGTIDADYRGEIKVILVNTDRKYAATISDGDRIAQMVICKVEQFELNQVSVISDTDRGEGGFGHTGK